MSALSNDLLVVAILGYALAMLASAAEYAFGNRGAVARVAVRQRELVGAGVGGSVASSGGDAGSAVAVAAADDGGSRPAGPEAARIAVWAGWTGAALTFVGWLAHVACLVTRGLAAGR